MIGLILLSITWLLLRFEQKGLATIGFNKPKQRLLEFIVGLFVAAFFCVSQNYTAMLVVDFSWELNPKYTLTGAIRSFRWVFNSVVYEELLFRGYLLYKAIQYLGAKKGCLLSAVAFGIYHWFSYGILGQWSTMFFVFLLTAPFGLALSYAFVKTGSIILPIALHLGWNITHIMIFSKGPIGQQLLISQPENSMTLLNGWDALLINILIPLLLPILIIFWLRNISFYRTTKARDK